MQPRAMSLDGSGLVPPKTVGVMILLDRSGSMGRIKRQMEEAFGEFVAGQRAISDDGMWLSLYQFDGNGYDACYERVPLHSVGPLVLVPRGSTPLIDAMHRFGEQAAAVIADQGDKTERLLLVFISDGGENASHSHTWAEVKAQLDGLRQADCEAIFFGTMESVLEGQQDAGIPAVATMVWDQSQAGVNGLMGAMSYVATMYRGGAAAGQSLGAYAADSTAAVPDAIREAIRRNSTAWRVGS